ncbi:hypothetical protein DRO48_00570 [Candidatus Bathyarchaeota archaeon]|nr:MAG: hypothetical protein DRO48_00570 [Candidatus Bathyarchaeota archaeon]
MAEAIASWLEKKLTRKLRIPTQLLTPTGRKTTIIVLKPSRRFIYAIIVAVVALSFLFVLEALYLLLFGELNDLILSAIVALASGITGSFLGNLYS